MCLGINWNLLVVSKSCNYTCAYLFEQTYKALSECNQPNIVVSCMYSARAVFRKVPVNIAGRRHNGSTTSPVLAELSLKGCSLTNIDSINFVQLFTTFSHLTCLLDELLLLAHQL